MPAVAEFNYYFLTIMSRLTVRFMNETNFLSTAIISLNDFDGIPSLTTSTVSWEGGREGERERGREGGRVGGREGRLGGTDTLTMPYIRVIKSCLSRTISLTTENRPCESTVSRKNATWHNM